MGKKSRFTPRDVERPRVRREQQAGVVDARGDQPGRVLLGVAVGVLEDAVRHAHRQGGDEARRGDHGDARVERAQVQPTEPAAARPGDGDARRRPRRRA